MFIHYNIYRTGKNKDKIIDSGKIQYNLQNDSEILILREIIYNLLNKYTSELPQVKQYGSGYIGKVELLFAEITNDDNITTPKEAFETYQKSELNDIYFKWNKSTINDNVKVQYKGNTADTIKKKEE